MNKRELSRFFYLSQEIKSIEERIYKVKNQSSGISKLTGMPLSHQTKSNPVDQRVTLLIQLEEILNEKKTKAIKEQIKIEKHIGSIEDPETKIIFEKRYLEFKMWEKIGMEMAMSVRSVYRKHSEHLKKEEKKDEEYNK